MPGDLSGRVALITGAAQGIGRATALRLARAGAHIVVNDVQEEKAHSVAQEISALGGTAIAEIADVAVFDQVTSMVSSVEHRLGPIAILVNNAGGLPPGARFAPLRESSMDDIERFLGMNLLSMFACSRAVINPMIDAGFGRIVCVSSIAAPMGQMGGTAYSAAKAAVSGFVASLSKEAGRFGVRVNSVLYGNAPHPSRTPDRQAELDTWSHLGRVGRPGEFANAVMFLVSEESSYITGTTLEVDGGIMRMALL